MNIQTIRKGGERTLFRAARFLAVIIYLVLVGCSQVNGPRVSSGIDTSLSHLYPDFITANKDYFVTRIGEAPAVDAETFRLEITGLVDTPRSFSLHDLMALPLVELPLTVECIGNSQNGSLVSTAIWKGFRLYDLLLSLGLDSGATGVKYQCADGYYASHTMDQVKNDSVLGALFINGDTIPKEQGFPLRILVPGYYGAKQPAWVVSIEVTKQSLSDYWSDGGWDVSPPMAINSKIFFPQSGVTIASGDTLSIGGAAFGGGRVAKVEVTTDAGSTWKQADIVKSMDADNVWVFWLAKLVVVQPGTIQIDARATDIHGKVQPATDPSGNNGTNSWPGITVSIVDSL
jgi:DMSO/TMAO reductase YedYZ molybdopterin-dependent catalytic subunit